MKSIYWLIMLFCGSFFWIYQRKKKQNGVYYSKYQLMFLYFSSRIVLLTQITTTSKGFMFNIFIDLLFILLLQQFLVKMTSKNLQSVLMGLYIMNPLNMACIISGNIIRLLCLGVAICGIILCVLCFNPKLSKRESLIVWLEGVVVSFCGASGFLIKDICNLSFSDVMKMNSIKTVVIGIVFFITTVIYFAIIFILFRCRTQKSMQSSKSKANKNDSPISKTTSNRIHTVSLFEEQMCGNLVEEESKNSLLMSLPKPVKFTWVDVVIMVLLTGLSAILIFAGIGAKEAPETEMSFDYAKNGQSQVILQFDQEVELSKISIFLGYQAKRKLSLSTWDESTNEWKVFDNEAYVESVFCWNDVTIGQKAKIFGIVLMDGVGAIREMVVFDQNGNIILPSNSSEYHELFDEQEKYHTDTTYFYRTMFDEVYHARTAYETLHGLPIYEVSHPPLGKNLMSLGIKAFGMTPFGWRFVVGVFGVLMTPLFYAFALSIMKKRKYAVATAILLNLEFSHFTLSRIATIDIIVALFILLEFYFMYRFLQYERMYRYEVNGQKDQMAIVQKKEIMYLVLSGISMGCGMATKWTGVYATIGLAIIFFTFMWSGYSEAECRREEFEHLKKLFYICIVSFVVLPIIIYVLSYNPYVRVWNKNVIQCAYENSISMFQYHEKTIFDHPYASDWYEWPWMKTPLFDAIYRYSDGTESMVCTFGNPLIWWGGIIALFHHIYLWFIKKDGTSKFLCICYLTMFVPWIFIKRTVFIYQYFVSALILVIMLIHSLSRCKKKADLKLILFLVVAAGLFVLFYPIISGYRIPHTYVQRYCHWLSTWTFMA